MTEAEKKLKDESEKAEAGMKDFETLDTNKVPTEDTNENEDEKTKKFTV